MSKNNRCQKIGVFDSGFGGLNILRGIVKKLPEYDFLYLGDAARVPYGTRSPETVYGFTQQAVDFLFKKNCALIIFACNTASSDALRRIQKEYLPQFYPGKKVLGVLVPAVELAASKTKNGRVGVMATPGAVSSGAFERELLKINSKIKLFQKACPMLVPLVEAGEQNSAAADIFLKKYLAPLLNKKIDTLILGCTHYGILERKIKKITGQNIHIVSEAGVVAIKLKDYLRRHSEIEKKLAKNGRRTFYSTDLTENFQKLGSQFFSQKIAVRKAELR
ncbi:MAG: glutamate racemase [Parcubacteria group bacterium]